MASGNPITNDSSTHQPAEPSAEGDVSVAAHNDPSALVEEVARLRNRVSELTAELDQARSGSGFLRADPLEKHHLDHSPLGVVEWDRDFRICRWSKRSVEMFGWTAEEMVGRSWEPIRFVHDDDRARVTEVATDLIEGRAEFNTCGNRNFRKDGSILHCNWFNSVVRDDNGEFVSVFSLVDDVTDRVEAERKAEEAHRALAEGHLRQRLALDAGAIGTWDYDVATDRVRVDDQLARVFGIPTGRGFEGASMAQFLSLVHRHDRRRLAEVIAEALRNGGDYAVECRVRGDSNDSAPQLARWVVARGTVHVDADGRAIRALGAAVDITERKLALEELEQTKAILSAAIEASPAGIVIADAPDVRIRTVNAAALGIRGIAPEKLTNIAVSMHPSRWKCFYPDGTPYRAEDLPLSRAVMEGVVSRNVEVVIERYDGKRQWVLGNAAPVRNAEDRIVGGVVVFLDITDQRRAAEALRKTEAELAHVVRVSTMGEMVGGIAHELNQPLFAIQNYSRASIAHLEGGAALDRDQLASWLDRISDAAEHAGNVLVRLRDFVAKRPSKRTEEDLYKIVDAARNLTQFEASQRRVSVVCNLPQGLPPVCVDAVQVQQVLVNLIRNGIEAIPKEAEYREVEISASRKDTHVMVSVADTGKGLPPGAAQTIFDAFSSTKPQGMGLGLAIANTIVQSHGGELWADPEKNAGGAVFHFTLEVMGR